MSSSPDILVVGAGVLGLSTAAELARRGHAVTVLDPGGGNASSIAAGMLAPAMESLLDGATPDRAALLKVARDLWPDFAQGRGIALHREGAEWRGPDIAADIARLRSLGFAAERCGEGLFTVDDWRVEVETAIQALTSTPGLALVQAWVASVAPDGTAWRVTARDGRSWAGTALVVATGVGGAIAGLPQVDARRIAAVQPIKGQLTFMVTPPPPHVLRAPGIYVAPTRDGALIGATMMPGARDLDVDAEAARTHVAAALALLPGSVTVGTTRVGVRGATADGLPLAGAVETPGLHLALAPRRNGWLLGPLVARTVADGIDGRSASNEAAALDPVRFG